MSEWTLACNMPVAILAQASTFRLDNKFLLTKAGHNELQIDPQWLIYQMGLSYAYLGLLWPCEVFWYDFLSRSAAFSMNLMQSRDSFKIISLPSPIMKSSTRSSLWIRYKQRRRMVAPHLCTMFVLRCSYIQPTRALAEHTLLGWEHLISNTARWTVVDWKSTTAFRCLYENL